MLDAVRAGGQKAAEGTAAVSMKVIDQAEENTRHAFAAMRAAAQAGSLTDVMKVQTDYIREQSSRSMTQAREIGELILRFGREAMSGMTGAGGGSAGTDDKPTT
jgi:hypothetical protein